MSRHHNTVERLDRPSAYYQSKVTNFQHARSIHALTRPSQNKRRRYNDRDDDKHEDPNDNLRNATTLYVGNLYVYELLQTYDNSSQANMLSSSFYTTEEQIHELFAKYVLQP
jgi:nuclear cap-binding protein subunit 2